MDPVTGGIAATFAIVSIVLFLQVMKQSGVLSELQKSLDDAQRDLKKTTQQLSQKVEKYNKKAQQASKNQTTSKDQKSRIATLQDDLHTAKADLGKAKDQVKSFSTEVNRLRIEREELRHALNAAKNRAAAPNAAPRHMEPAVSQSSDAAEAAPAAPRPENPKTSMGRLERDLERAHKDLGRESETNNRLKRRLVETTADYRAVSRKNEHNRRAYVITQLQLDLLQDENYTLKHGTPPPFPQADKAAKRKALLPEEERLVINLDAEPIQLPSAEELDAAEAAPSAAIIERAADRIPEPEPEPEVELEPEFEPEVQAEIEAEIEAELEAAAEPEPEVAAAPAEPRDSSVKRRRKVKTEDVVAAKPATPPRPTS
jgi:hypothetical protein